MLETDVGQPARVQRFQTDALLRLGTLEHDAGNLEEAERLFREALRIKARSPEANDTALVSTLIALGQVLVARGAAEDAHDVLTEALRLRDERGESSDADLVVLLSEMSRLSLTEADYASAEPLLQRVLAIKQAQGDEHSDVATVLASLGAIRMALGDLDGAERRFRDALAIRERWLAPNHFSIAATLVQLADAIAAQGKLAESIGCHQRALAIREPMLGAEHPSLSGARARIADLQRQEREQPVALAAVPWAGELMAIQQEMAETDPRDQPRVTPWFGHAVSATSERRVAMYALAGVVLRLVAAFGFKSYVGRKSHDSPYVEAPSGR